VLALTLTAAACGSSSPTGSAPDPAGTTGTPGLPAGTIHGTGSSFVDAFHQAAIEAFAEVAPDVVVNYNAVGSGQGKKDFAAGLNDFAGTDSLAKDSEVPAGVPFVYVPTVAAPITIAYNLPGVPELRLGADTLAGLFQRTITTWDDPAIQADNPGVDLPATAVVVARRSDGSGTTGNFTKYLTKAAPSWKLGSGDTVAWPADTQAGAKNSGVAQIVTSTPGAVGYVDLADARAADLVVAALENRSGAYVLPTLDGATAAMAGATVSDDGTYDPLDAAGAAAYPITSPTYLLLHTRYSDPVKGADVVGFVSYLLGDGQDLAASVDFARLPDALLARARAQLAEVTHP
jgi:phosphate transport system substrate-binding protein